MDSRVRRDVVEFEPLAAPRPGQVEGDVHARSRPHHTLKFVGHRRLAAGKISAHGADATDGRGETFSLPFQIRLMSGQRQREADRIAAEHPPYLCQAEVKPPERDDFIRPRHFVRPVSAPPC